MSIFLSDMAAADSQEDIVNKRSLLGLRYEEDRG